MDRASPRSVDPPPRCPRGGAACRRRDRQNPEEELQMNNYAQASGTTIRLERRLPGPIERVWAYIVDPQKRALWWVGGEWDLRVGGKTHSEWDHTRLSHEPTPEAWKSFDGMTTEGTISRYEPPRLLAYKGDMGMGEFEVTFELR